MTSSQQDSSVLHPGVSTTVTGMRQALEVLQSATLEVKRYLLDEMSIIYECRICNNMFRSLANMIAHKRSFCSRRYNEVQHIFCDKIGQNFNASQTVLIEKETIETVAPEEPPFNTNQYNVSFDAMRNAGILKEIKSEPVVNRLLPPRKEGLNSVVNRLNARFNKDRYSDFVLFEPIRGTNASFQTLARLNTNTAGSEYMGLMADKSRYAVVGPDSLELPKDADLRRNVSLERDDPGGGVDGPASLDSPDNIKENKEVETNEWRYSCPLCGSSSFLKVLHVVRHLQAKHNKSVEEARKMRNKIKAGRQCRVTQQRNKEEMAVKQRLRVDLERVKLNPHVDLERMQLEPEVEQKQVQPVYRADHQRDYCADIEPADIGQQANRPAEQNSPPWIGHLSGNHVDLKRVHMDPQAMRLAKVLGLVNRLGVNGAATAKNQQQRCEKSQEEPVGGEMKRDSNRKQERRDRLVARRANANSVQEEGMKPSLNSEDEEEDEAVDKKPQAKKARHSLNTGCRPSDIRCQICAKAFRTPTFLAQHYASGHFRQQIMEDFASDLERRKCSLCGGNYEGGRLIAHIGATHKMYQEYLKNPEHPDPTSK